MILDDTGIHLNCLTKPYGFVAPDAKVWFKDFDETDQLGNTVTRTYLMTTGFLWTGQFQEVNEVFKDNGKPHSMELDDKTIEGHWTKDANKGLEFFIINDAIFSKLCILGDDVEPCFEGSGITAPQVSTSFTLDSNFKHTLFEMMQQLTEVLKGGNEVADIKEKEFTQVQQDKVGESLPSENNVIQNPVVEPTTSFVEKKEEEDNKKDDDQQGDAGDTNNDQQDDKDDDDEDKKKYTLLESEYNQLKSDYSALEQEIKELKEFKANIENEQKDKLIEQFYMLSDEDKKDVIENKVNYTLDEIESKLAVICFKKKVNFNLEDKEEIEDNKNEKVVTTFNMNTSTDLSTPDWVKEVENTMNNF